MNLFRFSEPEIIAFFLVLVRMSTFIVSWPVFGAATVSSSVKILFSLGMTFIIFPVVQWKGVSLNLESYSLIWLVVREAFIGLTIGYLARFFFFAFSISGQIISVSMGLSGTQLFNPALGERSTAIDQFQIMIASLIFLAINGHHLLLSALFQSFDIVPISTSFMDISTFLSVGDFVQYITVIGVKLAAPVMMAILIMNLMMAIIGRAVPQINVLITSLPVNILVGFVVLIVSLPIIIGQMDGLLEETGIRIFKILKNF